MYKALTSFKHLTLTFSRLLVMKVKSMFSHRISSSIEMQQKVTYAQRVSQSQATFASTSPAQQ